MGEIDKHIRKTENKLRKLQFSMKDKHEERISHRNITGHGMARQRSRSKHNRDVSPKTNPNTSVPRAPTRKTLLSHNPTSG